MTSTAKPIVIYHGNCADGFSAAWVFWSKYGDNFDYYPGVYSKTPPDVTERIVYLVDFSYKRSVVTEMIAKAASVTLIDHHETAINDLKGLEKLQQYVDINHSGSMLAWRFVYGDVAPPLLLGHVEDRDLWRFKLPNTREIQADVFSFEYTFENWSKLMSAGQAELLQMSVAGAAIERKHHKDIAELVGVCKRFITIGGHSVPTASLPYTQSSDAGHLMASQHPEAPFAACYWDTPDGRVFSLRSLDTGANVAKVAEQYGGGGHAHASGFKVDRSHELARV